MLNTINELANALDVTERQMQNALDCYARGKGPARLAAADLVRSRWASLASKPPVAEWLRRCLKLS